jgi:hypothetical protein
MTIVSYVVVNNTGVATVKFLDGYYILQYHVIGDLTIIGACKMHTNLYPRCLWLVEQDASNSKSYDMDIIGTNVKDIGLWIHRLNNG